MFKHPDYLWLLLGMRYSGTVAIPIKAILHGKEAIWITENAEFNLTLAAVQELNSFQKETNPYRKAPQVRDLFHFALFKAIKNLLSGLGFQRVNSSLACLFYCDGTTERPKVMMINHRILKSMALSYFADVDEVKKEDAAIYSAPFSYSAVLYRNMHV